MTGVARAGLAAGPDGGDPEASWLDTFSQAHGLTQAQQDALFALLTAARDRVGEAFRELRDGDAPLPRERVRARIEAVRSESDQEARELLDADQFEAFKKMRDESRGPGGRGRGGGQGQGPREP